MQTYSRGQSSASQNTVYPLALPIDLLLEAEHAARFKKETTGEFIRKCIECDLEGIRDRQFFADQNKNDAEVLKRLSKTKKITIIQQEE